MIAAVVENAAGQRGLRLHPGGVMIGRLFTQLQLDGLEKVPIENGRLLASRSTSPLKLISPI